MVKSAGLVISRKIPIVKCGVFKISNEELANHKKFKNLNLNLVFSGVDCTFKFTYSAVNKTLI